MGKGNIEKIEEELQTLLSEDKKSWVKIYELMEEVEEEKLYEGKYRSFTAWVNELAIKSKVHVSLLWSRKKAGKVYAEYQERAKAAGRDVPDMREVRVSPDNFNLVEKIAGSNSAIADNLMDKVVAGELKRQDLKHAWEAVRADKENVRVTRHDKQPERTDTALSAADIVLALSGSSWIPDTNRTIRSYEPQKYRIMTEFAVQTGTSRHARRMDVLALETITEADISLHGIEIKVDKHDLLNDHKMQEYVDFCDYFWIAVPEELLEDAKSIAATGWGILTVNNGNAIVAVKATHQDAAFREKTIQDALIKLL